MREPRDWTGRILGHRLLYRQARIPVQGIDIERRCLRSGSDLQPQSVIPLLRLREIILIAGKIVVDKIRTPVLDPAPRRASF